MKYRSGEQIPRPEAVELFRKLEDSLKENVPEDVLDEDGLADEINAVVEFLSDNGTFIEKPGYQVVPTAQIVIGFDIDACILKTHTPVLTLNKDLLLSKEIYVVGMIELAGHLAAVVFSNAMPHRFVYKDIIGKIRFLENASVEIVQKKMER